jgi:hypothetical protein
VTERTRDLPIATGVGEGRSEGFAGQVAISKSRFLSSAKHSTIPAMLPETHRLIEAVTEPLADNAERRMAAQAFLGEKFDADHPGVAEATARIEAAGRRKFPKLRKALPCVLAVLAISWVIASHASTFHFMKAVHDIDLFEPWEKPALPTGLTEEQRLLLGDPALDDLEQKRRLHLHAPQNPAYFAEYASAFLAENDTFPPELRETAVRVDPDNAFFFYFLAGQTGKAYTKNQRSGSSPQRLTADGVRLGSIPREAEFTIHDQVVFEEALKLVEIASTKPNFETYTNEMTAARVRLLPVGTMADFGLSLIYSYGTTAAPIIQLRKVADLLNARAEQLSKSGQKEDFISLVRQRDAFIAHLGRNQDLLLVGELVHQVIAVATLTNFHAAADRLGLTEMAENYRMQGEAFQAERDMRDIRAKKEDDPFPEDKSSSLHRLVLPMVNRQVNTPPPLSEADFEPMRRAEHELLGGLGLLAIALILPLAALESGDIQGAKTLIMTLAPPYDPNAVDEKGRKLKKPEQHIAHIRARVRVFMALKDYDKALADAEEVYSRQYAADSGMSQRTMELDEAEKLRDEIRMLTGKAGESR